MKKTTAFLAGLFLLAFTGFASAEFVDNGDGTITDTTTKLLWQKTYSGSQFLFSLASDYCTDLSFAGYTDWRLPTIEELQSIIDNGEYPTIDPVFTCATSYYWSSTESASDTTYAWAVYFVNGNLDLRLKTQSYLFSRCVRGIGSLIHVNPTCYSTIGEAIENAATTATIKIAQGTYSEAITLNTSKTLTLQGGWDSLFSTQTPNTTFIKAPKAPQGSLTLQMITIQP